MCLFYTVLRLLRYGGGAGRTGIASDGVGKVATCNPETDKKGQEKRKYGARALNYNPKQLKLLPNKHFTVSFSRVK